MKILDMLVKLENLNFKWSFEACKEFLALDMRLLLLQINLELEEIIIVKMSFFIY